MQSSKKITKGELPLLTTSDVTEVTDKKYVTDAELVVIGNTSGTNTGDQDLSGKQDFIENVIFETTGNFANIQTLINDNPVGSTIYLKQNTVYTQTKSITLKNKITIYGNGATIKRGNQTIATTTNSLTNTSTVISVNAVPSDWVVGDRLQVYDGDSYTNVSIGQGSTISSISGLNITLSSQIGTAADTTIKTWAIGSTVRKVYNQITITEDESFVLDNITFDGNKANNSGNYYWAANSCISGYGASKINNCRFIDMPNEALIGCGFTITNCYAKNINGSFVHQSTNNTSTDLSRYYAEYSNNLVDTSNIEYVKSGHSEGVITFSATAGRTNIHNNFFFNGTSSVLGYFSGGSGTDGGTRDFIFVNNFCRNFVKPIFAIFGGTPTNKGGKISVSNNIFDNCGTYTDSGALGVYDEVVIWGNQLWGGTVITGLPNSAIKIQDFAVDNIKGSVIVENSVSAKNVKLEDSLPYVTIKSTQGTGDLFKLWSSYFVTNDFVLRNETTGANIFNFLKNGYLQLYNSVYVNGAVTANSLGVTNTPTTSAGTYDILTRNTSTGVVEKVTATISGTNTGDQDLSGLQPLLTNPITGTGTTNYLSKFTGASALGNSVIYDNGTNVGIGTTSPLYKLDLVGNDINSGLGFSDGTSRFGNIFKLNNDIYFLANRTSTSKVYIGAGTAESYPKYLTIDGSTGNVGIGTTTPVYKLEVIGSAKFGASGVDGDVNLYFQSQNNFSNGLNIFKRGSDSDINGSVMSGAELGYHSFYGWDGSAYRRGAYVLAKAAENWNATSRGTYYRIATTPNGSTISTVALTVLGNGNVLIGTTVDNGADKLQVVGSIKATSSVQVGDNALAASASNVGAIRYRTSGNNSYSEMCMQTGASTYAWITMIENNW